MRRILGLAFAWAFLIANPLPALAQSPSYTTHQSGVPQGKPPPDTGKPSISVLGVPTVIKAPVAKPYSNSATQIHGGQPMKSGHSLIAPGTQRAQ